jgi:hypothetical protein
MKNMPLLVLSALVITGVIGILLVMNTQTTGQAYYQIQERPVAFQRVLTTEKCEPIQAKKHLGEAYCLKEVCINKINEDCLR